MGIVPATMACFGQPLPRAQGLHGRMEMENQETKETFALKNAECSLFFGKKKECKFCWTGAEDGDTKQSIECMWVFFRE